MRKLLFIILASIFLIAACSPAAEPTMSAEEVQGTAVAAAWTLVAETQAAIPTATPVPPTEAPLPTALPTNTIAPLSLPTQQLVVPSQPVVAQPTATAAASSNDCNKPLASDPDGPT